jgi:hypothetical protein
MNSPKAGPLSHPATMNPYGFAAALVSGRLSWDLNPESWRSRRRLKQLKDTQCGRKAVILCNGPSLLKTDFSQLEGIYTFGLNKINLLFEQSDFRPSAIVAVNEHVIEQNAVFYNKTSIPLFLDRIACGRVRARENVTFLHSSYESRAVSDVSMSLHQGFTVTFVAMQLALHMGFESVALVGCDHNFATKGPANAEVRAVGEDKSHFSPNYFARGQLWHLPDLVASEYYYSLAVALYASLGRGLYNCTEGGKLELLNRSSLFDFVKGGQKAS